jgi:hypothetical protein
MNNFVISYTHGKSLNVDLYHHIALSARVCVKEKKKKRKKKRDGAASLETAGHRFTAGYFE